ncbi:DUF397 domain-containing protein [Streptomyces sp. NPDC055254]
MNSSELRWFKSSYSGSEGDDCVEVALSWHKSTYSSGDGDNCVEVAACADAVHVRDSKVTAGPELAVTPGAWAGFVGGIVRSGT